MHADPTPALPSDARLMPLADGALLVSRAHAVWCRVPPTELPHVTRFLHGDASELPTRLAADLERHGFFAAPRAPAPAQPSVQLQLTNACNLACSYCCTSSGRARAGELGREHWLAAIDEIRATLGPGIAVGLLGGEPFLVPFAVELCDRILDHGLRAKVFTNGLLLARDDLAPEVARLIGRGAEVRVSLAGPTPELCDRVSGAVRFARVMAGLHAVHRHGRTPEVDLMLLPADADAVGDALPSLRAHLPPGTKLAFGLLFAGGREHGAQVFPSHDALEAALGRIALFAGETVPATCTAPTTRRREGCSCALGHDLHVRSDGTLFTCFRMEEPVGHLAADSFGEVYRRVRATPHVASALPTCRDCPLATLCGAGCRTDNLLATGDGDTPVCGPWRVQVLAELLADDRPDALEWTAEHLLEEAHRRGIPGPERLAPRRRSLNDGAVRAGSDPAESTASAAAGGSR